MISELHFLRPWWFLTMLPFMGLVLILWRQTPSLQAWGEICDPHLLKHLLQKKRQGNRIASLLLLFLSTLFMILSNAGPTWHKLPVATYKPLQPRVLILDMSEHMMNTDLSPDRLSRAKFKLHDLLARKGIGQFGLIVFTGEPFVVSPLTDDGQTISSLLPTLTSDIMPIGGQNLDAALSEARLLIKQAGYERGQILVLTADTPSSEAIDKAKQLADGGIFSSILPVISNKNLNPLFQRFATAGEGQMLIYSTDSSDLQQWLSQTLTSGEFALSQQDDISLWCDEGRWFLIPALLLLIPVFQRGRVAA